MNEKLSELAARLYGAEDGAGEAHLARLAAEMGLKPQDLARAARFVEENEAGNAHTTLEFTLPGLTAAAKRPRASRIRNKEGNVVGIRMHAEDAGEQRSMRSEIVHRLPPGHVPFAGEVELHLTIYRPMLASWPPYKQLLAEAGYLRVDKKPDYDNYAKLVTDAMRGVVFVDDSLVVVGNVSLHYSRSPRLEAVVSGRARSLTR